LRFLKYDTNRISHQIEMKTNSVSDCNPVALYDISIIINEFILKNTIIFQIEKQVSF